MKMKRIIVLATVAVITAGCFQGNKSETGPRETLETFYIHLCNGDFDGAGSHCLKPEMDGYLEDFRTAWEKNDSTVIVITSDILSEMTITITDEEKNGESRSIFYKLTSTDSHSKEKIATLKKEEGAWKIEAITDRL